MKRKVVRDIQKKDPKPISLLQGPGRQNEHDDETNLDETSKTNKTSRTGETSYFEIEPPDNAIDCSGILKGKSYITGNKAKTITDVTHPELTARKKQKVMYHHIEADAPFKVDRVGESMRLFAAGLAVLFLVNIVNVYHRGIDFKNDLVATATTGYESLLQGGDEAASANFSGAEITFAQAQARFAEAQQAIALISSQAEPEFGRGKAVESADALLKAAQHIASAGQNFSRGIKNIQHLPTLFIQANIAKIKEDPASESTGGVTNAAGESLTEKLKEDLAHIEKAITDLREAALLLNTVDAGILPANLQDKFQSAKTQLAAINQLLTQTQKKIPAALALLGDRHPHRYLVLLQNDTEARPTGGFIGSYLIVDINDGYITKMDFHDIYELDGQLQEYIEPPEDIAMVSDNWRMRDSNYSPDYTISAEKAAWFLQKQKGPSVDTVIAINQSFVQNLLKISGPVQLESLEAAIDEHNYQTVISYIVETKDSGVTAPKTILKELMPAFQAKLFEQADLSQVFTSFMQGVQSKKILLYSRNESVQTLFDEFNLSGRIIQTAPNQDYLAVTATSVGGNKSDKYMQQTLKHYTIVRDDGTVLDELSITRKHTWSTSDFEEWKNMLAPFGYSSFPEHIMNILGQGKNKVFMKVYVPQGAQLIATEGISKENLLIRHDQEIGKDYFMFTMEVEAGYEETVAISYELPQKLEFLPADNYHFFAQIQPSYNPSHLEKKIYFKPGIQSYKEHPAALTKAESGTLEYQGPFTRDLHLSALVGN